MTREEIIDGLEIYTVGRLNKDRVHITVEELQKFIDAIESLEQEPCDDAISRQAVLDIAKASKSNWIDNSVLFKRVNALPPVNPQEPKTGHWINRHIIANKTIDMIVCSECGEEFSYDAETGISEYNFCPNCGARMIESQESEG